MQAEITRGFNMRLKRNFDEAGIRMAAPQLTVRVDGGGISLDSAGGKAGADTASPGVELVTRTAGKSA